MGWGGGRQIFGFLYFIYIYIIWVFGDPTFPGKPTNKVPGKGLGRGTSKTFANFRVYLSKTARTFGLLYSKRAKSRFRLVITWFQCRFDFGRQLRLNTGPSQSVLRIFARNFVKTCLGVPGSGSFRKKADFFLLTC